MSSQISRIHWRKTVEGTPLEKAYDEFCAKKSVRCPECVNNNQKYSNFRSHMKRYHLNLVNLQYFQDKGEDKAQPQTASQQSDSESTDEILEMDETQDWISMATSSFTYQKDYHNWLQNLFVLPRAYGKYVLLKASYHLYQRFEKNISNSQLLEDCERIFQIEELLPNSDAFVKMAHHEFLEFARNEVIQQSFRIQQSILYAVFEITSGFSNN